MVRSLLALSWLLGGLLEGGTQALKDPRQHHLKSQDLNWHVRAQDPSAYTVLYFVFLKLDP